MVGAGFRNIKVTREQEMKRYWGHFKEPPMAVYWCSYVVWCTQVSDISVQYLNVGQSCMNMAVM